MTPENQLILLLARGTLPLRVQERALALLATPLDWDRILERVTAEEVYPLFHRNLETLRFPGVPEHARTRLQDPSRIDAFRNTLLTEELVRVLTRLGDAGIPTIPLKGVALAQSLYGDPRLRVCVDIDILVPRQMVNPAFQVLLADGYTSEFTSRFFSKVLLRHDIEFALSREDREIPHLLELHWGILWGGRSNNEVMEDLWAEAHPATVLGAPAYALTQEWQILFLAAHAARHKWQGLKWLVDIHELCSSGEIKWEIVKSKADRLGWEEMLRLTLHVCHALFETPIPVSLSHGTLPPWLELFPASTPSSWRDAFFPAHLLRRPAERLRHFTRVLLVPTLAEHRLLNLPSFLSFLYYPLRPLRLGCKWGWSLLRGRVVGTSL